MIKKRYSKGGFIDPLFSKMECEAGKQIFPVPQINFNIDWEKMKELIKSGTSCFAYAHRDTTEAVFPLKTNLSDLSEEKIMERLQSGMKRTTGEM